jgi:cytochrome c oxidase subunit 4
VSHVHETLGYRGLLLVLAILLTLTAITIGVSRFHFGVFNVWVALAIAATKATLVLSYFMHLRYESPLLRRGFLVSVLALTIMIGFVFLDTAFRGGLYVR